MQTGTIHQVIHFNASPKDVFEMIMNEDLHSDFTGGNVKMSREIKGEFSVFEGYCHGYNIEIKDGEKIVQAWNFKEEGWPDDHYSTCTFLFKPKADGCELEFTQTEIPEHKVADLTEGWESYYWQPILEYFENN